MGHEFLEQPLPTKAGIVVVALGFLYNISMTVLKGRKTAISPGCCWACGGWRCSSCSASSTRTTWCATRCTWWFVVHLWVEGVGADPRFAAGLPADQDHGRGPRGDRQVDVPHHHLALVTGILGTGHHFYFIGLPGYWQWVGSVFSALEPIPFFAMTLFAFNMVQRRKREHPNQAAVLWTVGCAVMGFLGAGLWGFIPH